MLAKVVASRQQTAPLYLACRLVAQTGRLVILFYNALGDSHRGLEIVEGGGLIASGGLILDHDHVTCPPVSAPCYTNTIGTTTHSACPCHGSHRCPPTCRCSTS
jgi:hypothetical protein